MITLDNKQTRTYWTLARIVAVSVALGVGLGVIVTRERKPELVPVVVVTYQDGTRELYQDMRSWDSHRSTVLYHNSMRWGREAVMIRPSADNPVKKLERLEIMPPDQGK